jgi:hypothetical protein
MRNFGDHPLACPDWMTRKSASRVCSLIWFSELTSRCPPRIEVRPTHWQEWQEAAQCFCFFSAGGDRRRGACVHLVATGNVAFRQTPLFRAG